MPKIVLVYVNELFCGVYRSESVAEVLHQAMYALSSSGTGLMHFALTANWSLHRNYKCSPDQNSRS